jgi:hypothetical protein
MEDNQNPVYTNKEYGKYREMLYSSYKEGNFEKEVGYHGEADRVILQQAWDTFSERIEDARQRVLSGKVSPLVYHMEKTLLDPLSLSMMAGINILRVKWHFRPSAFRNLSEKTLGKYAKALNITVDQLKKVE